MQREFHLIIFFHFYQKANEHLKNLNKIEDKANRQRREPNVGLQL